MPVTTIKVEAAVKIKWGPQKDDWFSVERVSKDIDGVPCEPCVHLREGLCPDVWLLDAKTARALGRALLKAAANA